MVARVRGIELGGSYGLMVMNEWDNGSRAFSWIGWQNMGSADSDNSMRQGRRQKLSMVSFGPHHQVGMTTGPIISFFACCIAEILTIIRDGSLRSVRQLLYGRLGTSVGYRS